MGKSDIVLNTEIKFHIFVRQSPLEVMHSVAIGLIH